LQTKSTKIQSPIKPPHHAEDDTRWIKRVIQEEHIKPLEVTFLFFFYLYLIYPLSFIIYLQFRRFQRTSFLSMKSERKKTLID
jgi:hypothetical protein